MSDRGLFLVVAVVLVAGMARIVIDPVKITNDVQLLNDRVIRDGAMTWEEFCTPAYERFCPPPSQRQGE